MVVGSNQVKSNF